MKGHLSLVERMKTKNFYIIVLFILATSVSLWLLSYPTPSFRTIVTKTHKQISSIKQLPSNMQMQANQELTVDAAYLRRLGFSESESSPALLEEDGVSTSSWVPVIASGVEPGLVDQAVTFIASVQKYIFPHQLVLYDLGLASSELLQLKKMCNTTWNCVILTLNFEHYPSHVRYLDIKSYRPICIQHVLTQYGAVIWVDTAEVFLTGKLNDTLARAQASGILGWRIEDPVSAIVHPSVFRYFKASASQYYFLHAVESRHLVVYNTPRMHRQVMLPWLKCALLEECISPMGAQASGCNPYRKPRFKYSGCHRYDMAALNVILGQVFSYSEEQYVGRQKLFGSATKEMGVGMNVTSFRIGAS